MVTDEHGRYGNGRYTGVIAEVVVVLPAEEQLSSETVESFEFEL